MIDSTVTRTHDGPKIHASSYVQTPFSVLVTMVDTFRRSSCKQRWWGFVGEKRVCGRARSVRAGARPCVYLYLVHSTKASLGETTRLAEGG